MNNLTSKTEKGGVTCVKITEAIERLARLEKILTPFADEKDLETFLKHISIPPYKYEVGRFVWAITVAPKFGIYEIAKVKIAEREHRILSTGEIENVYKTARQKSIRYNVLERYIFKTEKGAKSALEMYRKKYEYKGGTK